LLLLETWTIKMDELKIESVIHYTYIKYER
jgi:hypothetical protein